MVEAAADVVADDKSNLSTVESVQELEKRGPNGLTSAEMAQTQMKRHQMI